MMFIWWPNNIVEWFLFQRELKTRLVDLGDVQHSLDDTIGYLQQVETDLKHLDYVYGDPHVIEAHIKKVQVWTHTCNIFV